MAFFDFLTGNNNKKRDAKNKMAQQGDAGLVQQQQAWNTTMPWLQQNQNQAAGLFNPAMTASTNATMDSAAGGQQAALNAEHAGLMDMWANPGYTAGEQRGIKLAATAPVAGAFGDAAGQLRNQVARTNNSAGFMPALQSFAHAKARDLNLAGVGATQGIADKRIAGQQFAVQGLGNEVGHQAQMANSAMARQEGERANLAAGLAPAQIMAGMYGAANSGANANLGAQFEQANKPGFMSGLIKTAVGAAAGGLTGGLGGAIGGARKAQQVNV